MNVEEPRLEVQRRWELEARRTGGATGGGYGAHIGPVASIECSPRNAHFPRADTKIMIAGASLPGPNYTFTGRVRARARLRGTRVGGEDACLHRRCRVRGGTTSLPTTVTQSPTQLARPPAGCCCPYCSCCSGPVFLRQTRPADVVVRPRRIGLELSAGNVRESGGPPSASPCPRCPHARGR